MNALNERLSLPVLSAALALALSPLAACAQNAGAPDYHLVAIEVAGAVNVYVEDVNDAGQAVGYYQDDEYANHAFVWSDGVARELAIPPGNDEAMATGINDAGQVVGYASAWTEEGVAVTAVIWNADDPTQYQPIPSAPGVKINPAAINDQGVVAGLASTDGVFRAVTWTQAGGLVDYGTPTGQPGQQTHWAAINASGVLVGGWNYPVPGSPTHATLGALGVPGMSPLAEGVDEVASMAYDINDAGVAVGAMDLDASGNTRAVAFENGTVREIPGALLGLASAQASGINNHGVVVGRAQDPAQLAFKAFVHVDGTTYDLLARSDNAPQYPYLLRAAAVNDRGAIVGLARTGAIGVASFLAVPERIFADGFETATR